MPKRPKKRRLDPRPRHEESAKKEAPSLDAVLAELERIRIAQRQLASDLDKLVFGLMSTGVSTTKLEEHDDDIPF